MLGNIIVAAALLLILLMTVMMFLGGLYIKALLLTITDCLLIYMICLLNKSFKPKKTCKYVKKSNKHNYPEYTLSSENNEIILNNISYTHKKITAVFLLNGYAVFTLKDKTYFILKPGEAEGKLHSRLKDTLLPVYAWCNTASAKAAAKITRKRYLNKVIPVIILTFTFFFIFCIVPNTNRNTPDNTGAESAQAFTFDMSKDIYDQLNNLYEYYEVTHNFEATTDIYYSYVNQAANTLVKTNYHNSDITENKELLFISSDNFYYIKSYTPEHSGCRTIEIISNDSAVTVQENEKGYTVTFSPDKHDYTAKDMYRVLTEYDYISKEYPLYQYAWYQLGSANVKLKTDRLIGNDSIKYRMGLENISVYTESKDKEFKVHLQNIPQSDLNNFIDVFTAVSTERDNLSPTFSQLVNEIDNIILS